MSDKLDFSTRFGRHVNRRLRQESKPIHDDLFDLVTPECLNRGSTVLTTTLSHVEWVGGLARISPGFPLKACGNDGRW